MSKAIASMPSDPFDLDFERPGHDRKRGERVKRSQVVRGGDQVNYIGDDPGGSAEPLADFGNQLASIVRKNQHVATCPRCGAAPKPIQVQGPGGKSITIHQPCQHQLEAQAADAALADRMAATKVAKQVHGNWDPPRKLQGVRMADMYERSADSDDYAGTTAGLVVARYYLENFDEMRRDGCGIFFHGGPGTGKSMLSAAIANEVAALGYFTAWVKVKNLYERLIRRDADRVAVLDAMQRVDLLVLDELVSEKDTPAMLREFLRLADDRHEAGRATIVTSNFTLDEISDHFDAVLSRETNEHMGGVMVERFLSRLCPPRFRTVRFRGPDMRLRLAKSWGPELAPEDQ